MNEFDLLQDWVVVVFFWQMKLEEALKELREIVEARRNKWR